MNDAVYTVLLAIGVASFIGVVALSAGVAWVLGRSSERARIRAEYRLVSKNVWALGEAGMVLNLARKKLICPPGESPPDTVTVAFADHTVVLKPAATVIADAEDAAKPVDAVIGGGKEIE